MNAPARLIALFDADRVQRSNRLLGLIISDYLAACERSPAGLRVAWSPTLGYAKPAPEVLAIAELAAAVFEDLGCSVELVEHVMDDPVDMWTSEFYAGIGTRLGHLVRDSGHLLDPPVVEILSSALNQLGSSSPAPVSPMFASESMLPEPTDEPGDAPAGMHDLQRRGAEAVKSPAHPVSERAACAFHLAFVGAYLVAIGFHALCALNHWRDR